MTDKPVENFNINNKRLNSNVFYTSKVKTFGFFGTNHVYVKSCGHVCTVWRIDAETHCCCCTTEIAVVLCSVCEVRDYEY